MAQAAIGNRLDRPVDDASDHVLGPPNAEITLVEYGSYACPYCRAANDRIAEIRDQFGDRLRYVFRHRPLTDSDIALRAAELVERVDSDRFWDAHIELMTRSHELTEDDLRAVAVHFGVDGQQDEGGEGRRASRPRAGRCRPAQRARQRRDDHADVLHQRPPLRRAVGRKLVPRRDARLARPSRALGRARFRELGAVDRRAAAAGVDSGGGADEHRAGAGLRRVLGNLCRVQYRRRELPDVAPALGQRRAADDLLSRGRPRDQARVHRRPSRQPALGRAADRRRDRRHGGAGADLCADHPGRTVGARLGRADGDRHGVRGRADRDAGPPRAGRAAHLPDRGRDRRRHRRDHRGRGVLLGRPARLVSRRRRRHRRRARVPQSIRRLSCAAVCAAGHRALGLRARRRPARHARGRGAGAVHPDASAGRICRR